MDFAPIAIVPIVIAVVGLLKQVPQVKAWKWLQPLLAVATGIILTAVATVAWPAEQPPPMLQLAARAAIQGIVNGLAGAGLYSAAHEVRKS